ncbi:MAG: ATP-binding cassette domain-containing protein [Muribaculaceae bacterium]|nr:ATP-binding cassette domain-containing protein [Muribaculaceae bacterium]
MIEVKNVEKSFAEAGGARQVLFGINATFYDGKTNLIIGQSGSGKTVLVKNIVGLFKPDTGQILYDGRDITVMDRRQLKALRNEIGMLFQGSALFDSETVLGNVIFPLKMFSRMSHEEQLERAQFCIDRVNLTGSESKYPSELSGGMQKRAAIARAIALNPKYLFCDEPNSGLDPKTSIVIDELLSDITHEFGITTIINTHDMNSVMGIGENIVFINKGHVGWTGTKDEIYDVDNDDLNNFVYATDLFRDVRKYRREHGYHKSVVG